MGLRQNPGEACCGWANSNDDGQITLYFIEIIAITEHNWPRDLLVTEDKMYRAAMKCEVMKKVFNGSDNGSSNRNTACQEKCIHIFFRAS